MHTIFKRGMIAIEDFGDRNFYKFLLKKKNKLAVYKKLVDLLLKIQKIYETKLRTSSRNNPP